MRLSSHNLATEQGRYNNVRRNNRNCKFCLDDLENEERRWRKPSVFKFLNVFSMSNVKQLCNLGKIYLSGIEIKRLFIVKYFYKIVIKKTVIE